MKVMTHGMGWMFALALLLGGTAARAQEFEVPKPGPEHEFLKQFAGTWDATVKATFAPNQPPAESKGVTTAKMGVGGFWLISDHKGDMAGQPFIGHGLQGYDTIKKKYVGVWVDSMGSWMMTSEGTLDKSGKILTETADGYDMNNKPIKYKMVTEIKDKDTRVFTMSWPGPDGKDQVGLVITYKRRAK